MNLNAASANSWAWHDNLFDGTTLWQYYGGVGNGNNAYRNCARALTPAGTGNLTLMALSYASDAWKRRWYATATPALVNAGSRPAGAAGLYHHTTQSGQAQEGPTQVDVGFHYLALDAGGKPADTDGDGVPDYLEDLNGNGIYDPPNDLTNFQDSDTDDDGWNDGEEANQGTNPADSDTDHDGLADPQEAQHGMNPLHPDTDGDGWPDGAELAEDLELFPSSYTLTANRDLATTPRTTALPDATVTMNWAHDQASTMDATGYLGECYPKNPPPPPDAITTKGTEYRWPAVGMGTKKMWKTTLQNPAKQYDPTEDSERPPAAIPIPLERCTGFQATRNDPPPSEFRGTFTRSASTILHLKSNAPTWPKPKRSVKLACSATDLTVNNQSLLNLTAWTDEYTLGEPNTWPGGAAIDPGTTPIVVDGQRTDPGGNVLVQINKLDEKDVTPDVQEPAVKWYRYDVQIAPVIPVLLTWSRHPLTNTVESLQAKFDEGADRLAADNDGAGDDVSAYFEFFIQPARHQLFPDRWTVIVPSDPLPRAITPASTNYLWITQIERLEELLAANFANVKIVASMRIKVQDNPPDYEEPLGATWQGHPSSILINTAPAITAVHEWGHMAGCTHRSEAEAIMYQDDRATGSMVEINAGEKAQMEAWPPGSAWGW